MENIEVSNFIKTIMKEDLESGKVNEIITRFPPEPNAYLHIGHARAIITNFELAKSFGGYTNLIGYTVFCCIYKILCGTYYTDY